MEKNSSLLYAIPGGAKWATMQEMAKYALSPNIHKLFRYAKIKGNVFVFAFTHPLALQEFKLKQEEIKANMRTYWKNNVGKIKALDIKFQNVHAMLLPYKEEQQAQKNLDYEYKERAKGNFTNNCKDKGLHAAFEAVRSAIKERQIKC
jgi:hypothetical protein